MSRFASTLWVGSPLVKLVFAAGRCRQQQNRITSNTGGSAINNQAGLFK